MKITDIENLKINQYEHGGSRIYIDRIGERQLLVDTYHTEEFANYIYQCIIDYIKKLPQ